MFSRSAVIMYHNIYIGQSCITTFPPRSRWELSYSGLLRSG